MIKNFIVITFRNISNQKISTFVNIFGLSIGMACSIIISLYIIHELSFDKFYSNADKIYRVGIKGSMRGSEINQAITAAPMAKYLRRDYDDIISSVRIARFGSWLITYHDKKFDEENLFFTDSTFFDIFSLKVLKGDKSNFLKEPRSIVFTESTCLHASSRLTAPIIFVSNVYWGFL